MSGLRTATFAFRLVAVWILVRVIEQAVVLPSFMLASSGDLGRASLIGFSTSIGLQALLGILIWLASAPLARWTFGSEPDRPLRGSAELGALALRIVGLLCLDAMLHETWNVIFKAQQSSITHDRLGLGGEITAVAIVAALAAALLLGGGRLARRMFPSEETPRSIATELQPVAFSVLGLVILMNAVPVLVSNLASIRSWAEDSPGAYFSGEDRFAAMHLASLLRVALGFGLFLGGPPIARAWRWIQTAGLGRDRSAEPKSPSSAPQR